MRHDSTGFGDIAAQRKALGLRPECPACGHDSWVYLKTPPDSWSCQRHGWLPREAAK